MNWCLLLLVLKFLAVSWAKPIVPSEGNNELLTDKEVLDNLSNQTFTLADEAIDLNKTWNNLFNSTKSSASPSYVNKIGENFQKVTDDIKNVTVVVVQKESKESNFSEKEAANEENDGQVLEVASNPHEISDKAAASSITIQFPTESSTEHINGITENTSSSNDNKYQLLSNPLNTSQHISSTSTFSFDPAGTKVIDNLENSSNDSPVSLANEDTDKDLTGSAKNEQSMNRLVRVPESEIIVESITKTEPSSDLSTPTNAVDAEQVTESTAQTTQEIETETIYPNTQTASENLHKHMKNVLNQSEKIIETKLETSYTTEPVVINPVSKIISNFETSVKDLMPVIQTEKIFTRSANSVENFDVIANQSSESALASSNNNVPKQIIQEDKSTEHQEQSSSESNTLKQNSDALINQVVDLGKNIRKPAEEAVQNSSIIQPAKENSNEPDTTTSFNESVKEPKVLNDLKSEDISEQAPTFKQAVDSLAEGVLEIGHKLVFIPEKTPDQPAELTNTPLFMENVNKIDNSSTDDIFLTKVNTIPVLYPKQPLEQLHEIPENLDSTKTDGKFQKISNNTKETITTTENFLENLKDNHYNNQKEVNKSDDIDISTTYEMLIGTTLTDTGKSVSDLFSTNKNNSKDITESSSKSPTDKNSQEKFYNFESSIISSTEVPPEDFHETSTNTLEDFDQKYEVSTTETSNGHFQIPEEIVKSFNENVNDSHVDHIDIERKVKEVNFMQAVHLDKRAQILIHEQEVDSTSTTQQPEIVTSFETTLLNDKTGASEIEVLESQETNKSPKVIEAGNEDLSSHYNTENEIIRNKNEATTITLEDFNQKCEVSATETPNGHFRIPEEIVKSFNENVDGSHINHEKILAIENPEHINKQNEKDHFMQAVHLDKRSEILAHGQEAESTSTSQQPEIVTSFETTLLNNKASVSNIEVLETQEINKSPEIKEARNLNSQYNTENKIMKNNEDSNENATTSQELLVVVGNTTEDNMTFSEIAQETSTNAYPFTEEPTNTLNRFENTVKTLTENENVKQEETVSPTTENTEPETATLTPNPPTSITLSIKFTTSSPLETTKVSPKKLEEKLQVAVKALAEELKKLTVWKAEHEGQEDEATTFKANRNQTTTVPFTTPQGLNEQLTSIRTEKETSTASYILEEPHSSDVIRKKFIDKFADYYEEKSKDLVTVAQPEKQLADLQEIPTNLVQITESPVVLTTLMPAVENIETFKEPAMKVTEEITTTENNVKESIISNTSADNRATEESTREGESATTEFLTDTSTTTTTTMLARVSLQKDTNKVSLNTNILPAIKVPTQKLINETYTELRTTKHPTEPIKEEAITLTTSESPQQEHPDTPASRQSFKKKNEESSSHTQRPLMQSSFMEEKQQQVESTTENDAETQSATTSGHTDATVNPEEQSQQQTTTEAEIYLTTQAEVAEITDAAQELEAARSLPLPPPKLEYSQNEDGVEVFYGYSNVKHN